MYLCFLGTRVKAKEVRATLMQTSGEFVSFRCMLDRKLLDVNQIQLTNICGQLNLARLIPYG